MVILYELSWLWTTLGIALGTTVAGVVCTVLICSAAKKKLSRKVAAGIGAIAFVVSILVIIVIAQTPMPL